MPDERNGKIIVAPDMRAVAGQVGFAELRGAIVLIADPTELIAKQVGGIETKSIALCPPGTYLIIMDKASGERFVSMTKPRPLTPDGELRG